MSNKTILIVDDSQMMLQAIQLAIPPNVFSTILEARNGVEAVRIYKESRPDFVTMDITMPELDGLDCIKQLRQIDPGAKILIISALADVSKSIEAVRRGAKGFLLKPINTEKLQQAITKMVTKND